MKKKQQKNKSQIITALALTMFGLALVLSVIGLSQTVINVKQEQMARNEKRDFDKNSPKRSLQ